jgi:hypothetical protein
VVADSGVSASTPDAGVDVVVRSRSEPSLGTSERSSAAAMARDAETPSAVATSVTSLRTLPTAAAAIVTATTAAENHATPMPLNLLMPVDWCRFFDGEITDG